MSAQSVREFLKVQRPETHNLRLDALPSGDKEARAVLRTTVNFRNGHTRTTYILKGIESFEECAGAPVSGPAQ